MRLTDCRITVLSGNSIELDEHGTSRPTRVSPQDSGRVEDPETMEGQRFDEDFYLLDLDGSGLDDTEVPRTFQ